MKQIKMVELVMAVNRMPRDHRCMSPYSDRAIRKAGGLENLLRVSIASVGDVRMMMDDELDKLIIGLSRNEPLQII